MRISNCARRPTIFRRFRRPRLARWPGSARPVAERHRLARRYTRASTVLSTARAKPTHIWLMEESPSVMNQALGS
jgi:hypothetical protein